MANNVIRSNEPLETARLWGTMKLQANAVRTVIMHALMHTQGVLARPWQQGLSLGADRTDDGVAVVLSSERDWSGRLVFDIPRHRLYMGFTRDWPRMNTLPEWFVVDPTSSYTIEDLTTGDNTTVSGAQLHEGIPVDIKAGTETLLRISN
jgi:hypothetical protein